MDPMSSYENLPEVFEDCGIVDSYSLEGVLAKIEEVCFRDWPYADEWTSNPWPHGLDLVRGIAWRIRNAMEDPGSLCDGFGIQQISGDLHSQLTEERVKQSLFLSERTTILMDQPFVYQRGGYTTDDGPADYVTEKRSTEK